MTTIYTDIYEKQTKLSRKGYKVAVHQQIEVAVVIDDSGQKTSVNAPRYTSVSKAVRAAVSE